ncbi:MAG: hypothetical protein KAJ75_04815 [Alphaproteobacteria bacterium]|nr:hypothetical protein [Alphaproteobacteria bacterium]
MSWLSNVFGGGGGGSTSVASTVTTKQNIEIENNNFTEVNPDFYIDMDLTALEKSVSGNLEQSRLLLDKVASENRLQSEKMNNILEAENEADQEQWQDIKQWIETLQENAGKTLTIAGLAGFAYWGLKR